MRSLCQSKQAATGTGGCDGDARHLLRHVPANAGRVIRSERNNLNIISAHLSPDVRTRLARAVPLIAQNPDAGMRGRNDETR